LKLSKLFSVYHNFKSASGTAPSEALVTVWAYLAGIEKSGTRLFPGADSRGDGGDRLVAQMFVAFAGVVAVTALELKKESSHAQRAKRGGERLVTGGAQFGWIEHFNFHRWILV
jgi:hypothetical protein